MVDLMNQTGKCVARILIRSDNQFIPYNYYRGHGGVGIRFQIFGKDRAKRSVASAVQLCVSVQGYRRFADVLVQTGIGGEEWLWIPGLPASPKRQRAWWAPNDAWRWPLNLKPPFSKDQVKNLKALSVLMDESNSDQRILKAEIARELGNFEECLLLLFYQFEEGYDRVVSFTMSLAEKKIMAVKSFNAIK
jgi:hypothetical protein